MASCRSSVASGLSSVISLVPDAGVEGVEDDLTVWVDLGWDGLDGAVDGDGCGAQRAELADEVADRQAGTVLGGAGHRESGEHDGQMGVDRVLGPDEHGPGGEVGLGHPEGLLHVPQVVVVGDDLARSHDTGGDVRDVALQSDELAGPGQGSLVQAPRPVAGRDEPGGPGRLLPGDDGPSPVLLRGQGVPVPGGPLAGVDPHRPPRPRMRRQVPHRLGAQQLVVLTPVPGLGGDGVDDLPVCEGVPVPPEVGLQVDRCLRHPGAHDEGEPGLVKLPQVLRGQHPGVRDDDHVLDLVAGVELLDDRDDRLRLGLVSLEEADLEGEPLPVHQQPDHDLRVHPAFFREADLAEVVFLLRLEIQGGDVVQTQGDIPGAQCVGETQGRELVTVLPRRAPGQGAAHGLLTGRGAPQVTEYPPGVQDRGWFHDPGDHQVPEHRITHRVKPEIGEHAHQRVVQHPRGRGDHPRCRHRSHRGGLLAWEQGRILGGAEQRRLRRPGLDPERELTLPRVAHQVPGPRDQQAQLGLGVRRAHMRHDPAPPADRFHELDRRRA